MPVRNAPNEVVNTIAKRMPIKIRGEWVCGIHDVESGGASSMERRGSSAGEINGSACSSTEERIVKNIVVVVR